jgi:hypothetical protein
MKIILSTITVIILLVSCSKSVDTTTVTAKNSSLILGKWQAIEHIKQTEGYAPFIYLPGDQYFGNDYKDYKTDGNVWIPKDYTALQSNSVWINYASYRVQDTLLFVGRDTLVIKVLNDTELKTVLKNPIEYPGQTYTDTYKRIN